MQHRYVHPRVSVTFNIYTARLWCASQTLPGRDSRTYSRMASYLIMDHCTNIRTMEHDVPGHTYDRTRARARKNRKTVQYRDDEICGHEA
jgi:hypothetical protein